MKNFLLLICATFVFSSCSIRQMLLNNLDWLAIRQLEDTFDLNDKQIEDIEPQIKRIHNQLKTQTSLQITGVISRFKQNASDGLNRVEVDEAFAGFQKIRKDFLLEHSEAISRFLKGLSEKQLNHYETQLLERDEDLVELLDSEDFEEEMVDYVEDQTDRLHYWFGDLTPAQMKIVAKHTNQTKDGLKRYLEKRRKRRALLMTKVRLVSEEELKVFFDNWAYQPNLRSKLANILPANA